jgi:hypothetical protein
MGNENSKGKKKAVATPSYEIPAPTEQEKQREVQRAYEQVRAYALYDLQTQLRGWSAAQIEADLDRVNTAIRARLSSPDANVDTILRNLVLYQYSPDRNTAINSILAHLPRSRATSSSSGRSDGSAYAGWRYRHYNRHFEGNSAVVAYILDRRRNPPRSDYSVMLYGMASYKMKHTAPPRPASGSKGEAAAAEIYAAVSTSREAYDYVEKVVQKYDAAVEETTGKTDTQLGAMARYVTYT